MALTLPRTLTPSKMTSFTNCPLSFQFSVIEHRPEPPSPHAVKGTLVHAALEGLFWNHEGSRRTVAAATGELERAWTALQDDPEFVGLGLSGVEAEAFLDDARGLVRNYFALEDPRDVRAVGVELGVELAERDGMRLRGIIDRLDMAEDGALTVVDYKTGRAPSARYEQSRMGGVHTYALLCERLLGRAPVEVRLLYLRDPVVISAVPTGQILRGQEQRTVAVWKAIERACVNEDFRPKTGPLCNYCAFKPECPAFGVVSVSGAGGGDGGGGGGESLAGVFEALESVDQWVDERMEPLRGRPEIDRVASALSNLADYGLVWVLLAGAKGRRSGPGRRRAVVALGAAGLSSMFVNRSVKAAVARQRPEGHVEAPVRTPSSSSFPSGHTLAAFCTAVVLPETSAGTVACVGFAGAVAASRVHLRAHHATDVVGGAAIGTVLGLVLRPLVGLVTPGRGGRRGVRRGRVGRSGRGMPDGDAVLYRL